MKYSYCVCTILFLGGGDTQPSLVDRIMLGRVRHSPTGLPGHAEAKRE